MARQVVLEIQANSGQAASALEEVETKVSQLKQGFRKAGEDAEAAMDEAGNAASSLSGQITGSLQNAIDQTAAEFQKFGKITLQSFSRLEAAGEDFQRRQQLIGDSAEELGQKIQNAYIDGIEAVEGLNRAQQNVFNELVDRTDQGVRSVDSMEAAFADLQKRADLVGGDLQQAFEKGGASIRQTGRAVDDFSGKAATMRSSVSATSNNLAFELTQASQDAAFGLQGVANQIPLISRQFSDLTKKSGSFGAAMKSLGSTFLGPVGIISGITLAASFLPDLISLFSSGEDSAEGFEKALENTAGSVFNLAEAAKEGLETTKEFTLELEEGLSKAVQNLESQIEGIERAGLVGGRRTGVGARREPTQSQQQALQNLKERRDVTQEALSTVKEQIQEREAFNALLREQRQIVAENTSLSAAQVQALQEEEASLETILRARQQEVITQERAADLAEGRVDNADRLEASTRSLNALLQTGTISGETFAQAIEGGAGNAEILLQNVENGIVSEERAAEAAKGWIDQLDDVRENAEVIRRLIDETALTTEDIELPEPDIPPQFQGEPVLFRTEPVRLPDDTEGAGGGDIFDIPPPEEDTQQAGSGLPADVERVQGALQSVRQLRRQLSGTKAAVEAEITSPLRAAKREVNNLRQQAQALLLAGFDPDSEIVQEVVDDFKEAKKDVKELSKEGTEQGITLGAQAGTAAFQGIMSTAIGEITREIENNFARAITSAVLQALSSAAVEKLANLLEGDSEDSGDTVDKSLSLANSLVNAFTDQKKGSSGGGFGGISSLLGSGKSGLSLPKGAGAAAGAFTIGQVLGRTIRPSKNKGAGLAGLGGAGVGAILGSVIPGLGTLIGAGIGGGLGGLLGGIFQDGGPVSGPGGPRSDIIPALLSDKEFVMNAQTAQAAPGLMKALNEDPSVARSLQNSFGRPQALSAGGHVGNAVGTNGSMPSGASGVTVNIDTEVRRLRGRELGLVIRENEQRKAQFS